MDKQRLPRQKNLTVNKRDELLKHLLLEHKIQKAKEEESSPKTMKEEKVAPIQQKERTRILRGESHRVKHGKGGEPIPGAALGQLLVHRGGRRPIRATTWRGTEKDPRIVERPCKEVGHPFWMVKCSAQFEEL